MTILKFSGSWIEKNYHQHAFPPLKWILCIKSAAERHAWKQNLDGDKNNPKISGASVTNFHLILAWAEENFPILRDLLGPIEPEISFFFSEIANSTL